MARNKGRDAKEVKGPANLHKLPFFYSLS